MGNALGAEALDQLFLSARSFSSWKPDPVSPETLRQLYDLLKMGPTSMNTSPARFVFCQSDAARQKLADCAAEGNKAKILAAPVTVIIGMDMRFHDKMPELFPHMDAKPIFEGNEKLIEETAKRNSTLQGAALIMAARSLGLDTGPMSGFDPALVDAAFFAGTSVRANFICSLGYGDATNQFPRLPRLKFEDACQII